MCAGLRKLLIAVVAAAAAACSGSGPTTGDDDPQPDAIPNSLINAFDEPIAGLSRDDVARFDDGDALFDLPFRAADGLGPLFIRTACSACHEEGARGPGLVTKMAIVGSDGVTPAPDQSPLAFGHTVRMGLAAGATTPIKPPINNSLTVKVTTRFGPPVLGRGYIEAVDDAELVRLEAEQAARGDAIHGKIGRATFASVPNPDITYSNYRQGDEVLGRFGVKSRIATLDDFTADAFQGDMGLTTPMRPIELANPDGLADDDRPGVDLPLDRVDRISFYLRRIAIPLRVGLTEQGAALFAANQCSACHVPMLRTRADYPIRQIVQSGAPIYSDLLLHDMGAALSDGNTDGAASSTQWRTAPLIGMRFMRNFMHDGRAKTVADAIAAHDGEALGAARGFQALSADDQRALLAYVEAL